MTRLAELLADRAEAVQLSGEQLARRLEEGRAAAAAPDLQAAGEQGRAIGRALAAIAMHRRFLEQLEEVLLELLGAQAVQRAREL